MPWLKKNSAEPARGAAPIALTPCSFTSPTQMNHQMTFKNQQYVSVNHSKREPLANGEYPMLNPREHLFKEIKIKLPADLNSPPDPAPPPQGEEPRWAAEPSRLRAAESRTPELLLGMAAQQPRVGKHSGAPRAARRRWGISQFFFFLSEKASPRVRSHLSALVPEQNPPLPQQRLHAFSFLCSVLWLGPQSL